MRLLILNWEKYNPRSDKKKGGTAWFRFQRNFFRDPFIAEHLSKDERTALVYVFCECDGGIATFSPKVGAFETGVRIETFESLVRKLVEHGKAKEIAECPNPVRDAPESDSDVPYGRTDGRTDDTDGQGSTGAKSHPPSPVELAELWNQTAAPPLARVQASKVLSGTPRFKAARARLADEPDLGYWRSVIERVNASAFCLGENDRGWKADFDFLVKPETHVKVLEGKYDRASTKKPGPRKPEIPWVTAKPRPAPDPNASPPQLVAKFQEALAANAATPDKEGA